MSYSYCGTLVPSGLALATPLARTIDGATCAGHDHGTATTASSMEEDVDEPVAVAVTDVSNAATSSASATEDSQVATEIEPGPEETISTSTATYISTEVKIEKIVVGKSSKVQPALMKNNPHIKFALDETVRRRRKTKPGRLSASELVQVLSRADTNPHLLVSPHVYGEKDGAGACLQQPFRVYVHPQVGLVADIHCRLCTCEVIGLLAGKWIESEHENEPGTIFVQSLFPCTSTSREDGDDGSTDVELSPIAELRVREVIHNMGMNVVGWYHSHPKFRPDPSVTDIFNQSSYQQLMRLETEAAKKSQEAKKIRKKATHYYVDKDEVDVNINIDGTINVIRDVEAAAPFIGLIVSPYDPEIDHQNGENTVMRWFHTKEQNLYEGCMADKRKTAGVELPMQLDVIWRQCQRDCGTGAGTISSGSASGHFSTGIGMGIETLTPEAMEHVLHNVISPAEVPEDNEHEQRQPYAHAVNRNDDVSNFSTSTPTIAPTTTTTTTTGVKYKPTTKKDSWDNDAYNNQYITKAGSKRQREGLSRDGGEMESGGTSTSSMFDHKNSLQSLTGKSKSTSKGVKGSNQYQKKKPVVTIVNKGFHDHDDDGTGAEEVTCEYCYNFVCPKQDMYNHIAVCLDAEKIKAEEAQAAHAQARGGKGVSSSQISSPSHVQLQSFKAVQSSPNIAMTIATAQNPLPPAVNYGAVYASASTLTGTGTGIGNGIPNVTSTLPYFSSFKSPSADAGTSGSGCLIGRGGPDYVTAPTGTKDEGHVDNDGDVGHIDVGRGEDENPMMRIGGDQYIRPPLPQPIEGPPVATAVALHDVSALSVSAARQENCPMAMKIDPLDPMPAAHDDVPAAATTALSTGRSSSSTIACERQKRESKPVVLYSDPDGKTDQTRLKQERARLEAHSREMESTQIEKAEKDEVAEKDKLKKRVRQPSAKAKAAEHAAAEPDIIFSSKVKSNRGGQKKRSESAAAIVKKNDMSVYPVDSIPIPIPVYVKSKYKKPKVRYSLIQCLAGSVGDTEAAAKLSREMLFNLPSHLISLRCSILSAICFGFYYSQNAHKVQLLKVGAHANSLSLLNLLCNATRPWLRMLALTVEEIDQFCDSLSQIYTCLWKSTTASLKAGQTAGAATKKVKVKK